jgi:hypothetical protein
MRLKREFWYYTTGESKNRDESVIVAIGPKVKELKEILLENFRKYLVFHIRKTV